MANTKAIQIRKIAESIRDIEISPVDETIYQIIFQLTQERKNQKISQEELASRTGLTKNTISRVETFVSTPTLQVLIKMANALGLNLYLQNKNT